MNIQLTEEENIIEEPKEVMIEVEQDLECPELMKELAAELNIEDQ